MLGFYKVFFTFCAVLVGLVFAVMGFWNLLLVDVVLVLVELPFVLVAGCVAFAFVALADYLGWGDQW